MHQAQKAKTRQPEAKTRQPEEKAAKQAEQEELTAIEDPARFQSEPDFWEGEGWDVRAALPVASYACL